MKQYINNKEFLKFFQGKMDINSYYTILTFQKGTQTENNNFTNTSVALAYNHNYCKIERFLINYDYSYLIKPSDILVNTFIHTPVEKSEKISLENMVTDGKFSKSFLTYFLFYLIFTKLVRTDNNYNIKDIRAIDYLYNNDKDLLEDLIESDYQFKNITEDEKIIINIPNQYYNRPYSNSISNHYGNKIELKPYLKKDLSPALLHIKQAINGKNFVDNIKLEQQIHSVNEFLINKGQMFRQKELNLEYDLTFEENTKTRKGK